MAAAAVFNTAELLEGILLQLPFADILKAKRVTKAWKQLIVDSVLLCRATFLAPDGQPILVDVADTGKHATHLSDATIFVGYPFLVQKRFRVLPFLSASRSSPGSAGQYTIYRASWFPRSRSARVPLGFWAFEFEFGRDLVSKLDGKLSTTLRSMLITQPPITALVLTLVWKPKKPFHGFREHRLILRDDNGITIGLMQDILAKMRNQPGDKLYEDDRVWSFGFRVRESAD